MIGQAKIQTIIQEQITNGTLAKCILLIGDKGSGKRTLAKSIGAALGGIIYTLPDNRVDTVRQMLEDVYKSAELMVCILPDMDGMSAAAKNALLKVFEEPPKNVYFILTAESPTNVLDTILSRAVVYTMDLYTPMEICAYITKYTTQNHIQCAPKDQELLQRLCNTPGEVQLLLSYDVGAFYEYVEKVFANIAVVSGSNSFKIANKINMKDDESKYDLSMFWKTFIYVCWQHKEIPISDYLMGIQITSKYLREIRNPAINKQMSFDNWLLDIREAWMYADD